MTRGGSYIRWSDQGGHLKGHVIGVRQGGSYKRYIR